MADRCFRDRLSADLGLLCAAAAAGKQSLGSSFWPTWALTGAQRRRQAVFREQFLPTWALTGAFHVDDAAPTSAEAIQKYFADEIISFHSCGVTTFAPTAARDQRQVVVSHKNLLSNNITKFASSTALHQSHSCRKCDHMFGKKCVLVVWFVNMDRGS